MLTNCLGSDFTLSLIVSIKGVKHVGCEKRVIFLDHACRKCFICCRNLWACLHFHLPLQKQNLSKNWSNTYSTTSQMWYPMSSTQHSGDRDEYSLFQASPGCIARPSLETKINHWTGNMSISSLQHHDSEQQKWVTWTQTKDSFLAIVVNVWLFKWLDLIQIWSSFPF